VAVIRRRPSVVNAHCATDTTFNASHSETNSLTRALRCKGEKKEWNSNVPCNKCRQVYISINEAICASRTIISRMILYSTITRRIVRRFSSPISQSHRPRWIGSALFAPLSQHRLHTCLSSRGIASDKSSVASFYRLGSHCRRREKERKRDFALPFPQVRTTYVSRSSHRCGTSDKGVWNVPETSRTGPAPLSNRSLHPRAAPFFRQTCSRR